MRWLVVLVALSAPAWAGSAPDLAFARAKAALAAGDRDVAAVLFDAVAERYPTFAHAGDAAWLALDALRRDRGLDGVAAFIERDMWERPLLLVRHRVFAVRLRGLYAWCLARGSCAPPPRADYEQLALVNLGELAANPRGGYSDELLFAAGWQFCISGHADEAERAWRVQLELFPDSKLAARARTGLGDLASCRS